MLDIIWCIQWDLSILFYWIKIKCANYLIMFGMGSRIQRDLPILFYWIEIKFDMAIVAFNKLGTNIRRNKPITPEISKWSEQFQFVSFVPKHYSCFYIPMTWIVGRQFELDILLRPTIKNFRKGVQDKCSQIQVYQLNYFFPCNSNTNKTKYTLLRLLIVSSLIYTSFCVLFLLPQWSREVLVQSQLKLGPLFIYKQVYFGYNLRSLTGLEIINPKEE